MPSKRTFETVAGAIHRSNETAAEARSRGVSIEIEESNLSLAHALADIFAAETRRFDHRLFLEACGYASRIEAPTRVAIVLPADVRSIDGTQAAFGPLGCNIPALLSVSEFIEIPYTEDC